MNIAIENIEYFGAAAALMPKIYSAGDKYTAEFKKGGSVVMGKGKTIPEALQEWELNLQRHLCNAGGSDKIVQYVMGMIVQTPVNSAIKQSDVDAHLASIPDPGTAAEVRRVYERFKYI